MRHTRPQLGRKRAVVVGAVGVAAMVAMAVAALATAGGDQAEQAIVCPSPVGALTAVPEAAQAEVTRELANLDKQLKEANERLVTSAGEGGPAFVDNAILGPLASKRTAALDRIAIAIGRVDEKPEGLEQFAKCALGEAGDVVDVTAAPPADAPAEGEGEQVIECPSPVDALAAVEVPASAEAEVERELANLDKQIQEANDRLVSTKGQGGANFVDNAILGPLADKRTAALNRIETAIGRAAEKPEGLEQFAECELVEAGAGAGEEGEAGEEAGGMTTTTAPAADEPADGEQVIACPSPVDAIPAVPAAAQAEVTRELANLDKQIQEANDRLVSTKGQGGPNFVDNAILGPLADKRTAALNRIETAIGRVAEKPEGLEQFAECGLA
ncbi:hypothetical protein ALI22I_44090 [Saccharothrix sp. ALI-22-I]|uniref:hypothetical protein n=1 Tax=Saccharothrix sp. ALI-22-I TaxID=1933778 RepID=UPI00097C2419|nr:hypothetical protein [Saccharothrix sp. ALI-22-I]ONI80333.1 hypothetical protein ALI22I_44090 [Saccharothrix sp. ALI-22-I]